MASAIVAENLRKTFKGGIVALDGLSFEVAEGTVFGLLGPNGAGKTTAVRILTTVTVPDSGSATVLGFDVVRDAALIRTNIGLAGQYAAVDENLTGVENLRMIGQLTGFTRQDATKRAMELLEAFELTPAAKRPAKTYSGGMRRRLDLAAALVHRPPMLFLDEPTTGLDPYSRQSLWQVIEELVSEGTTVLLTTQYLEEADRLADSLAVVDHGRVIARGTADELKAGLGTTLIDLELGDAMWAAKTIEVLESRNLRAHVDGTKVEVPLAEGSRKLREVLEILDQAGIEPTRVGVREPSLDDVFLTLTGHGSSTSNQEMKGEEAQ